ncbi:MULTISPECIES: AI-2E family transporter [unclassified Sulfurospirillum]|uniref:AI-2E family transporter n=1 Tax=unclassified Sulfurospirillum TaxID=2618290 RepID=UPI000508B0A0|nr:MULTISPECIES: AI-2E family transporter [unclassified Sulfurospirillum]KFL34639.1 permease [Sulfurospirillum sp. SCADC]
MRQNSFLHWLGFGIFVLIVWLFFPFLKSFFVALLMALAVSPLHHRLQRFLAKQPRLKKIAPVLSASIVTLVFSLIIFVPITLFLFNLLSHPSDTLDLIRSVGDQIEAQSKHLSSYLTWIVSPIESLIEMSKLHKDEITATLASLLGNGLKTFMAMLVDMAMVIVFFFFLTLYGRKIILFLFPIIPLGRSTKREFLEEMTTTMAVVFYSLTGVMVAQGVAFGVFIAFFDGYNALLLGFLAGIASIIPIAGTALVWIPIAANEYFQGNTFNAIIIAAYSWAMLAFFIDNIFKLMLLNFVNKTLSNGKKRVNEFIIFFAIVGGLATFGFWGFILGPAIIALAITTLRTLRKANRSHLGHA